jgi:hypothetical protein
MKNPSDRSSECASTPGDDYFIEPRSGFIAGTEKSGGTPVDVGQNRVYYVDGDVWIHSKRTYGFVVDGLVTIVATGNIHICDNIIYDNEDSLLGLVALGQYDDDGDLVSGGDLFFGDPRYGTTYTVSALMFAGNDFLYNIDTVTRDPAEPTTGINIYGNFAALNQVHIYRVWYTDSGTGDARAADFVPGTGWIDVETQQVLNSWEKGTIRQYRMNVTYDDRVRTAATRPPGLPRGGDSIFAGVTNWQEL